MKYALGMVVDVDLDEGSPPLASAEDLSDAIAAAIDEHVHAMGGARATVSVEEISAELFEDDDDEPPDDDELED